MVSGGVWAWGKTRPTKPTGENTKQWTRAELITTGKPYDGLYLGDVTPSDAVSETLIYLPENIGGKVVLSAFIILSTDYLGGVYITRLYTESEWLGAFGTNSTYAGSTADNWFEKTYLGSILHESVSSQLLTCDVPVMDQGTVSRRCWPLSSRELDSASSEVGGEFMPYFSTAQRRISYLDGGTTGGVYWMRTKSDTTKVFTVTAQGGFGTQNASYTPVAYRPSFVLPKDFKIQQRPDGSYTVYNDMGLMTLGDIEASGSLRRVDAHYFENGSIVDAIYLSDHYNEFDVGVILRDKCLSGVANNISWGTNVSVYSSSVVNSVMQSYKSKLSESFRSYMKDVTVKSMNATVGTSANNTLTTSIAVPNVQELNLVSGWDTGESFSYFNSDERRKANRDDGTYEHYRTRDIADVLHTYFVSGTQGTLGMVNQNALYGGRPMMFVDKIFPIRLLADGTYDLVPEDPALSAQSISTMDTGKEEVSYISLKDVPETPSVSTQKVIVKVQVENELTNFIAIKKDYGNGGYALLLEQPTEQLAHGDPDYTQGALSTWCTGVFKAKLPSEVQKHLVEATVMSKYGNAEYSIFIPSASELGAMGIEIGNAGTNDGVRFTGFAPNNPADRITSPAVSYATRTTALVNMDIYCVNTQGRFERLSSTTPSFLRPIILLSGDALVTDNGDGTYTFVGDEPIADLSIEIDWPESDPLIARQWVYNEKGVYQTMLLGGVASTEDAPAYDPVLANNTWAQIAQACADRDPILDSWLVGDEKDEVINGETLTFVIVGKDHDDLADGSGKAPLTFGMKNLMAETRQMNSTNTNASSFAGSVMYNWLSDTIYPNLPTELKDAIKAVNKKTASGGGSSSASSIRTDAMYLWLFAEIEVFGATTYSYAGEGTQYPYFATASERIKRLSNGAGNASYWWERSPNQNSSLTFCRVGTSGSANNGGAGGSYGVCFGFCV